MINTTDPVNETEDNPSAVLVFYGITDKGKEYLKEYGGMFYEGYKDYYNEKGELKK